MEWRILSEQKKSIFPNICWCCYCQFDNCDICIFRREVLVLLSWGFFVWFFSLSPSRQLSVLKELMMKYWTSTDNIYLEQYKSLAISFSLKKNLDMELFFIGKKGSPNKSFQNCTDWIKICESLLPECFRMKHFIFSLWKCSLFWILFSWYSLLQNI